MHTNGTTTFFLAVCLSLFGTACWLTCTNSSTIELRKNIEGHWIEISQCPCDEYNSAFDSLQTAEIVFADRTFSNVLYSGSGNNRIYDTSFSGKYYISKDTIELVLDNFKEVFHYKEEADNALYLYAAYSIDSNGVMIGDFRSVLWCCSSKKSGKFNKN